MTFANFAKLTDVKPLNSPTISSFEKIELEAKKITRGDLYIGDDIEQALENGAYAIVSSSIFKISDSEIAWFKATSIELVITKLLRYFVMQKRLTLIYAKSQEIELIKKIADKEMMLFLKKGDLKTIYNADSQNIIFCSDKELIKKIAPDFKQLGSSVSKLEITRYTMFLTSFIYKEKKYQNIKIPHIFIDYLENAISFLELQEIEFDIQKCDFTSHFYPIFVDKNLNIKAFGKSQRVIICSSCKDLPKTTWAKTLKINSIDELKNIDFNFAIINKNYKQIIEDLNTNQKQTGLF